MSFLSEIKNRTKLVRKRSLHRAKMAWNYWLHREPKSPVFILSTRRTGSNLLLDCLRSLPGASFAPEILNARMSYGIRRRFISKKAVLRHIAHSIHYTRGRLCGAKLMMSQMRTHGVVAEDLKAAFPSARFIILYRRSLLEQFVSLKIAEKTGVWQWVRGDFVLPDSIEIDPLELERFCDDARAFYRNLLASPWVRERSIVVSYEELVGDTQGVFGRDILPFLGVAPHSVGHVTRKQNTRPISQMIRDYARLKGRADRGAFTQEYSLPAKAPAPADQYADDAMSQQER